MINLMGISNVWKTIQSILQHVSKEGYLVKLGAIVKVHEYDCTYVCAVPVVKLELYFVRFTACEPTCGTHCEPAHHSYTPGVHRG